MSSSPVLAIEPERWLGFALDGQRFALPLATVVRVVRAAQITPLPLAPDAVAGAVDVGGRTLAVFNLRRRLRLPERELALSDQFIIARTSHREVALIVDAALGLIEASAKALSAPVTLSGPLAHLAGVLSLPDGMVLIEDLERFLTPEEDRLLEAALLGDGNGHAR